MEKTLVSVIVPVFNAESYLSECIESVLAQTYSNIELLLIDDGSLDRSGEICDQYASKDIRIKVIHKDNEGVSATRNLGLNKSKGEFLIFLDSDDFWIEKDFLNQFVQRMNCDKLDVIRGEYYRVHLSKRDYYDLKGPAAYQGNPVFGSYIMLSEIIRNEYFSVLFLIRRSCLGDIGYDVNMKYQEDTDFLVRLFSKQLRCGYLPIAFYAYRQHTENASFQPCMKNMVDAFSMCDRYYYYYSQQIQNKEHSRFYLKSAVEAYLATLELLSYEQYLFLYEDIDKVVHLKDLQHRVKLWANLLQDRKMKMWSVFTPKQGIWLFKIKRFLGNNLRKLGLRK